MKKELAQLSPEPIRFLIGHKLSEADWETIEKHGTHNRADTFYIGGNFYSFPVGVPKLTECKPFRKRGFIIIEVAPIGVDRSADLRIEGSFRNLTQDLEIDIVRTIQGDKKALCAA